MMCPVIFLVFLAVSQAAGTEIPEEKNDSLDDSINLVNAHYLLALLSKYGFTKPAYDDDFKDFARSVGVSDPDLLAEVRSVYDQPTLLVFTGSSGFSASMYSQEGLNEASLGPNLYSLFHLLTPTTEANDEEESRLLHGIVLDRLALSSDQSEDTERDVLVEFEDSRDKLGIANPKLVAFFFYPTDPRGCPDGDCQTPTLASEILEGKQEIMDEDHINLVHSDWVTAMISAFGFTKPAYDDQFREVARSLGVSDPDVFAEVRDIYDQPTLFVFVGPSGVMYTMFYQEGLNLNTGRSLLLGFILSSPSKHAFGFGGDLHTSPSYNTTESPMRDLLRNNKDAQTILGITNPKIVSFFFIL